VSTSLVRTGKSEQVTGATMSCAALVHCTISLCNLIEREYLIENLARIDSSFQNELNQLRQVATDRGRAAVEMGWRPRCYRQGDCRTRNPRRLSLSNIDRRVPKLCPAYAFPPVLTGLAHRKISNLRTSSMAYKFKSPSGHHIGI
jgi:hypothetical protein